MGSLKVALSSLLKLCTAKRIIPSGLAVSSSITTSCGSLGEESPFGTVESPPPVSNEKNQIRRVCKNIWKSYTSYSSFLNTHNSNIVEAEARYKTTVIRHTFFRVHFLLITFIFCRIHTFFFVFAVWNLGTTFRRASPRYYLDVFTSYAANCAPKSRTGKHGDEPLLHRKFQQQTAKWRIVERKWNKRYRKSTWPNSFRPPLWH